MSAKAHNLVADVLLSLDPFGRLTRSLAIDRSRAELAVEALVPGILGLVAQTAATPEGVGRLMEAAGRIDRGDSDSLHVLDDLIGSDRAATLIGAVAGASGLTTAASSDLAKLCALAVLDVLSELKQSEGLDAGGLATVLAAQHHGLSRGTADMTVGAAGSTGRTSARDLAEAIRPIAISRASALSTGGPAAADRSDRDVAPAARAAGVATAGGGPTSPRARIVDAPPPLHGVTPWAVPLTVLGIVSLGWLYDVYTRPVPRITVAERVRVEPAFTRPESTTDGKAAEAAREAARQAARIAAAKAQAANAQAEKSQAKAIAEREARQKAEAEARRLAAADAAAKEREMAEAAAARARAEAEARRRAEAEAEARQRAQAEARQRAEAEAAAARAREQARRNATVMACRNQVADAMNYGPIRFQTARATLTADSAQTLARLAAAIRTCPDVRVRVEGHTDSEGSAERNQRLSEQRSRAVADRLIQLGVGEEQLHAVGYGQSRPIASNETGHNRALNRRIEFAVEAN